MNLVAKVRLHWDRVSGWGLVVLGAVVLAVGWWKVSKTPYPAEQMPYIVSGGIVGALLVVFGAAMLISADLRDEWHKLDRVEALLTKALGTTTPDVESESDQTVTRIDQPRPQSAAGHRR
jgi:hypothetical protein